jgi:hypothetical protein
MWLRTALALGLAAISIAALPARADKTTVCTITVNSSDEKEAFRRNLPSDKYQFVELVERGRPDWLSSACRAGVQCDMLIISGHYDGGHEFFPSTSRRVNTFRSARWSASRAVDPARDSSRGSRRSIFSAATR